MYIRLLSKALFSVFNNDEKKYRNKNEKKKKTKDDEGKKYTKEELTTKIRMRRKDIR